MRNRTRWYEKHGISAERVQELKYISLQYEQYRKKARAFERGEIDREGGDSVWTGTPDPTGREAARIADGCFASARIAAIEQSAIVASPELHRYILRNVTRGEVYEHMGVPCGRRQFFEARRKYFLELDSRV